jgi:hypothetical protein
MCLSFFLTLHQHHLLKKKKKKLYYGLHSLLKDKRIGTNDECMIVLKDLFFPGFVMDAQIFY